MTSQLLTQLEADEGHTHTQFDVRLQKGELLHHQLWTLMSCSPAHSTLIIASN